MTRTISKSMAGILEELELENDAVIDMQRLSYLAQKHNVKTEPAVIASRLRKAGWLLPTSQRGVWEFSPAAMAGAFSKNDPLLTVIAYMKANPDTECFLCMQTAAWALGLADRIPSRREVAFISKPAAVPQELTAFHYEPVLDPVTVKGVPCLTPESIIVHIASKPVQIRSWESAMEWIPDVVYEIGIENLFTELSAKNDSVKRRTGYLLEGMYPEAAEAIAGIVSNSSKIRFGPRTKACRNNEKWKISDTILPFDPIELGRVK